MQKIMLKYITYRIDYLSLKVLLGQFISVSYQISFPNVTSTVVKIVKEICYDFNTNGKQVLWTPLLIGHSFLWL
jgi:hypothetical protein